MTKNWTIKRGVITAAGPGQQKLALQTMSNSSGSSSTVLETLVAEMQMAGIDDIAVIIAPGFERMYEQAAESCIDQLTLITQEKPRGYGDAILRAHDFINGQPFLHLVGDHVAISTSARACALQLVDTSKRLQAPVCGVQATHESELGQFGTVAGQPVANEVGLIEVKRVVEKPTPTRAEQDLLVSGLRHGYYYCFFGMHVLPPEVMDRLAENLETQAPEAPLALTPALQQLAESRELFGLAIEGLRFDLEAEHGLLMAQIAAAIRGPRREKVLAEMAQLLTTRINAS